MALVRVGVHPLFTFVNGQESDCPMESEREIFMSKKKITDAVEELLAEFMDQEGYELYNCEFIKEGRDWFLRVYVDRPAKDEDVYKRQVRACDSRRTGGKRIEECGAAGKV